MSASVVLLALGFLGAGALCVVQYVRYSGDPPDRENFRSTGAYENARNMYLKRPLLPVLAALMFVFGAVLLAGQVIYR
jgi:hypothetical protein